MSSRQDGWVRAEASAFSQGYISTSPGRLNSLTQARLGSMADVPDDLLEQIKYLERIFSVDQNKLKEVTNHFVKELEKGKWSVLLCR